MTDTASFPAAAPAGFSITRRRFLVTTAAGGLALGFHIPPAKAAAALMEPWASAPEEAAEINAWLVIGADDSVTIRVAQAEMGQGVFTALPMIVAEELECDWTKVRAEYASANRSLRENQLYRRMQTGGSQAVRGSRPYLQQAGAEARARLIAAAAARWQVPAAQCVAREGRVHHEPSGRSLNYGALAAEAAAVSLNAEPQIKAPTEYRLLGTPTRRLDTPPKVDGSAVFGIDVRLPEMLHATVKLCPAFGGKLRSHDFAAIKGMAGVKAAVPVPGGIGVVADSFWRARQAAEALPVEWDIPDIAAATTEQQRQFYRDGLQEEGAVAYRQGEAQSALDAAVQTVEALYEVPYLAHATMEPMSCTAHVQKDRVDVWFGTQNPEGAIAVASEITGIDPARIHVHNCFLGGGFGRRFYNDELRQAVILAKEAGRPVKLVWTRETDTQHDLYRPMGAMQLKAALGPDGQPLAWIGKTSVGSILRALDMDPVENGVDPSSVEGFANIPYAVPNQLISCVLRNSHVPVAFWRSVGSSQNAFVVESFVDELAHAVGQDPYAFRRKLLSDRPDFLKVLDTAAEKAGWGTPLSDGRARGIAIHESFGTIVAEVAEIELGEDGTLRVPRVVAAVDCGHVVNPQTVAMQIESAIAYGLSAALYGEITLADGAVEQSNFSDYQVLTLAEMPQVETHLALSGGEKWGGMGEPGTPPIAPAVCNAIFALTGKRIRRLPLSGQDLKSS